MEGDELQRLRLRCDATPPINILMVGGAIALTYNLEGVETTSSSPRT